MERGIEPSGEAGHVIGDWGDATIRPQTQADRLVPNDGAQEFVELLVHDVVERDHVAKGSAGVQRPPRNSWSRVSERNVTCGGQRGFLMGSLIEGHVIRRNNPPVEGARL